MRLCAADYTAGSARLLFRVPFAAPARGFDLSLRRLHFRICCLVPLFRAELPSPVSKPVAPGEAYASPGRGGMTEHTRGIAALTLTISPVPQIEADASI